MNYVYPGNFSIPQAVALGHLVDAAYNQYTQFQAGQAWVPPAGYNIVATFDAQEPWKVGLLDLVHFFPIPTPTVPFGFVATNGPDTFIVIRGTLTPLEWLDDATIQPVAFQGTGSPWGQTTQGFKSLYDSLMPQITAALTTIKNAGGLNTVYVTGHSLGAALALLVTAGVFIQFGVKPVAYTLSGPRAGDPVFAAQCDAAGLTIWRIFNTEDIVPTLPLAAVQVDTANAGMHGLTPITQAIPALIALFPIGYQHVGYPIAVTFHADTIADNHNQDTLYNSL